MFIPFTVIFYINYTLYKVQSFKGDQKRNVKKEGHPHLGWDSPIFTMTRGAARTNGIILLCFWRLESLTNYFKMKHKCFLDNLWELKSK